MQSRSSAVKLISSVVKKPLLRMLRWLSVAPLGRPVVPEVYWMLIGSWGSRVAMRPATAPAVDRLALGEQRRPVVGAEVDHALEGRALVAGLRRPSRGSRWS